jgi:hypothetical protein
MECDVVDVEGVFIAKGRIIACDPREVVLDDDLGDHVGNFILYCINYILVIMSIWRWLFSHTIFRGQSLKAFLKSYEDNHICNVDVEGAIGVKKNNIPSTRERKKPWMLIFACQGFTNCCLKNPFKLFELLFIVP